ncbi:MAG: hypothetical protein ACSLFP_18760 [Acidimicrobiales bacterium]
MSRSRLLLLALTLATAALIGAPAALAAQEAQEPATSTTEVQVPTNDIIPGPNSGQAPDDPGDRGGVLQVGLLLLVLLAIAGVVLALVRQSRRARSGG